MTPQAIPQHVVNVILALGYLNLLFWMIFNEWSFLKNADLPEKS